MGTAACVTTRAGAVGLLSLAGVTTRAGTVGSTLVLDWAGSRFKELILFNSSLDAVPAPVRNALGAALAGVPWVSPCLAALGAVGAMGAAARARSAHVLDMSSAGTSVPPWIAKFCAIPSSPGCWLPV